MVLEWSLLVLSLDAAAVRSHLLAGGLRLLQGELRRLNVCDALAAWKRLVAIVDAYFSDALLVEVVVLGGLRAQSSVSLAGWVGMSCAIPSRGVVMLVTGDDGGLLLVDVQRKSAVLGLSARTQGVCVLNQDLVAVVLVKREGLVLVGYSGVVGLLSLGVSDVCLGSLAFGSGGWLLLVALLGWVGHEVVSPSVALTQTQELVSDLLLPLLPLVLSTPLGQVAQGACHVGVGASRVATVLVLHGDQVGGHEVVLLEVLLCDEVVHELQVATQLLGVSELRVAVGVDQSPSKLDVAFS